MQGEDKSKFAPEHSLGFKRKDEKLLDIVVSDRVSDDGFDVQYLLKCNSIFIPLQRS
jgi:hypothetical protein